MPLSTVAKAALCICPPALMAGTVATVPAAKKAVHHATAPRAAAKPTPRRTAVAAKPATAVRQAVDCEPVIGGPIEPLVTYADPIPDEPTGGGTIGGPGAGPGAVPVPGGVGIPGTPPVVPPVPDVPVPGPVPEPSVWLTMIAGVGTLGALLRRRRAATAASAARGSRRRGARRATMGGALWSGSATVEAGDVAATVAVKSTVASVAGKAMMCVCPAAIVAGGVMTVPPVRQAVHAATVVPALPARITPPETVATLPCPEPMTVPVSTATLPGFPAAVATVPAGEAAPVAATAPATPVARAAPTPPAPAPVAEG